MKAKILIVGGGAMGTCTALQAATRTDPLLEPVVLIEKNALGSGSSGRSAAIVHQAYSDRVMAGMARDALKVYDGIKASTGRSVGFRKTGVVVLSNDPSDVEREHFTTELEMKRSIGIDCERLTPERIRALVPGIEVGPNAIANYEAAGGFVDAQRTISTFAVLARNKGAITRVGISDPDVIIENGKAVGVQTSDGVYTAPNVVLATGPWTPSILANLNVELPLRVVRTHEMYVGMPEVDNPEDEDDEHEGGSEFETRFFPDPLDLMPVAHPVLLDRGRGLHLRCEPAEGRSRVGRIGFDESDELSRPESVGDGLDPKYAAWARSSLEQLLPVYKDMETLGGGQAWITLTPDQRPIVGRVPGIEGLWVCAGFTGNDFHLAPSIGEGLAQMILGQPVSAFDERYFEPDRF